MATLTVWKFDSADGAEHVRDTILDLQRQQLIKVHDAAVVTWPDDRKKPKTKQLVSTTGAGATGGAFWGLLFGVLFFVPFFGMALGAAVGALSGALVDVGIDDDFITSVREKVTPGTSALFLLSSDAVTDRIQEALSDVDMELITTNLGIEDEEQLRAMLADED